MASAREHFLDLHKTSAEHHIKMAKAHRSLAKLFTKSEGIESADDIRSAHEGLSEEHIAMSEYHLQCCKSLDAAASNKAMMGDDGDRFLGLESTGVASVYKFDNRIVPRNGAPAVPDSSGVDPLFHKIVSVEDDA